MLTHWGRVTHISVSKLTIIGSDNSLAPWRRQTIIWTNDGILLIGPLGTNFSEILIGIQANKTTCNGGNIYLCLMPVVVYFLYLCFSHCLYAVHRSIVKLQMIAFVNFLRETYYWHFCNSSFNVNVTLMLQLLSVNKVGLSLKEFWLTIGGIRINNSIETSRPLFHN